MHGICWRGRATARARVGSDDRGPDYRTADRVDGLKDREAPARAILAESRDVVGLMRGIREPKLALRAIELIRTALPEKWQDLYLELLPFATVDGCELISRALAEAGLGDQLTEAVAKIPTNFQDHPEAVCWLWRGPSAGTPGADPPAGAAARFTGFLSDLSRSDTADPEFVRGRRPGSAGRHRRPITPVIAKSYGHGRQSGLDVAADGGPAGLLGRSYARTCSRSSRKPSSCT